MVTFAMSLQCSDCFSDLLCGEDSNIIFSGGEDNSTEYSSDNQPRFPDVEESITGLLEDERDLNRTNINGHQSIDASVRTESVAWILKVHRYYGFQPLTAFLSVNYFDRFLCSHQLPILKGWPLQLLSTACLSLAAKMEERLVPSLLDLQVEGAKFIFEPRNIQRMELLVLRVLEWKLRSISPFCYLSFFALKIDPTGTYTGFLVSMAKEIILSAIQVKIYTVKSTYEQRSAFSSLDHHASLLQHYFVQQMMCRNFPHSQLNMLSHGVMDFTKKK